MAKSHSTQRGLCLCGCGQRTPLAIRSNPSRGDVIGEPVKYIRGHAMTVKADRISESFWSRVDQSGGADACWPWTGCRGGAGYGQFSARSVRWPAHRFALYLATGVTLMPGEVAMHSCDNPPCCNPAHLRPGTTRDNSIDAQQKGRLAFGVRNARTRHPETTARGERHGRSILTAAIVRDIRRRYDCGEPVPSIARSLGLLPAVTRQAAKRITWKHVI